MTLPTCHHTRLESLRAPTTPTCTMMEWIQRESLKENVRDDQPTAEDHGAWIPYLIRKRRFAECMILAWQAVEDGIDQMVVQEFGFIYSPKKLDPRVDLLRRLYAFRPKIDFLKDMGRLSQHDVETIAQLDKERNNLFHGFVYESRHPVTIPEREKDRLMELARKASQIVTNRSFSVWSEEETGDSENKDIPIPERPSGSEFADEERRKNLTGWREQMMPPEPDESHEQE